MSTVYKKSRAEVTYFLGPEEITNITSPVTTDTPLIDIHTGDYDDEEGGL